MAKHENASIKDLSESRAEALSAILQPLSPDDAESSNIDTGKLSAEHVRKLSDKLGEILGEQADGAVRNEKGELLNEEGLPIVDINEPVTTADLTFRTDSSSQFDDPDLLPLWTLSQAERARRRAERERILDLLEEEERIENQRDAEAAQERYKEELEKRKQAAQKEIESLKKAKELQKKMGRALMRSVVESRDKAEKEKTEQAENDRLVAEVRLPKKKSVSFADDIDEDGRIKSDKGKGLDWGDVTPGTLRPKNERQPLKMHVVERHPRILAQAGPAPEQDSDDESDPGSIMTGTSKNDISAQDSDSAEESAQRDPPGSNSETEAPADEEISDWNDEDLDFAQHQREIALEYYDKRRIIGAETSNAMRAHTHDEDEWDQPEVPLEATLASAPPKPLISRFKARRDNPNSESSLASHSLGASVIPSSSSAMKRAVRMGKLENGKLVGADDGDSEDEVSANTRALLEALTRGEITNIGPDTSSAAPPLLNIPPRVAQAAEDERVKQPKPSKVSKFKLSVTQFPAQGQTLLSASSSAASTPTALEHRSSPKPFSKESGPEESIAHVSSSQQSGFTLPPKLQSALQNGQLQMPGMVVDSPSFLAPQPARQLQASETSPTSSLSPSSTAVATPTSAEPSNSGASASISAPMRQSVVERRPPAVGSARPQAQAVVDAPTLRASRFKTRRE